MSTPTYICMWEPGVAPSPTTPTPAVPLAGPFPTTAARPFLGPARVRQVPVAATLQLHRRRA